MKDEYEECGLCGAPLETEETQYCDECNLAMMKELLKEATSGQDNEI